MSLEQKLKSDFKSVFSLKDWKLFKICADRYFATAATIKKRDINRNEIIFSNKGKKDARLLFRNKRKRLFIGLGCELLIKAYYLKSGFYINKPVNKRGRGKTAFKFTELDSKYIDQETTIKFDDLIKGLAELERKSQNKKRVKIDSEITNSLIIAKIFRNKEAHIITEGHKYNSNDYDEIEKGIIKMYDYWFNENLAFQISFEQNEIGKFKIKEK